MLIFEYDTGLFCSIYDLKTGHVIKDNGVLTNILDKKNYCFNEISFIKH